MIINIDGKQMEFRLFFDRSKRTKTLQIKFSKETLVWSEEQQKYNNNIKYNEEWVDVPEFKEEEDKK